MTRDPKDGTLRPALLPRSIKTATPAQSAYLSRIQRLSATIAEAVEELDELIPEARDAGLSWEALGFVTGTTGSAVRKRWGAPPAPEPAPVPVKRSRPKKSTRG